MNVEYINPFIEATQQVFQMMTGSAPTLGQVTLKQAPYSSDAVVVIVGLTGQIRGQVVMAFSLEAAKHIASTMMGGMEVNELDEIAKSAISELGNMIMGNTATALSAKGIGIEITPPSMLMGQGLVISPAHMKTISVPLMLTDTLKMELDVSLNDE